MKVVLCALVVLVGLLVPVFGQGHDPMFIPDFGCNECVHGDCVGFPPFDYTCLCLPGWIGDKCDIRDVPPPSPTGHDPMFFPDFGCNKCVHGDCVGFPPFDYTCLCLPGWIGDKCDIRDVPPPPPTDPCFPNPCPIHMSNCEPYPNGPNSQPRYKCINPCSPDPCMPSFVCHPTDVGKPPHYACLCPEGTIMVGDQCIPPPCQPNPCNGSPCIPFPNGLGEDPWYECNCMPMWQGDHCDVPIAPCSPNPCPQNEICSPFPNGPLVPPFYNCKNPCRPNPCRLGENCIPNPGNPLGYDCVCPAGTILIGNSCQDPCDPNPCVNGQCSIDTSDPKYFVCICPTGYTGPFCQSGPCQPNPCQNGGQCDPFPVGTTPPWFRCRCPQEWEGPTCVVPVSPCDSDPCPPQQECVEGPNFTYECVCPPGTIFPLCLDDPCQPNPCLFGECEAYPNGFFSPPTYICNCILGWVGPLCDKDPCNPNQCQNGGACEPQGQYDNPPFICDCPREFEGILCETPKDPCDLIECLPPRNCIVNILGEAQCVCPPGTVEPDCTDPCSPFPCARGTCTAVPGSDPPYNCDCPVGWTGPRCDAAINPCVPTNPCPEPRLCEFYGPGPNDYDCVCPQGTIEPDCTDPCEPNPCYQGECFVDPSFPLGFECVCDVDWFGPNCDSNPCVPNSCENGDCIVLSPNEYECDCLWPWFGEHCTEHPCNPDPCINGVCIEQSFGEFVCECVTGWYGDFCEINPCDDHECVNGDCVQLGLSEYECHCWWPWYGTYCTEHPCDQQPCLNGGVCNPSDPSGSYTCDCVPPYYGPNCENYDDPCDPDPCEPNGVCFVDPNDPTGYYCECDEGWEGPNCNNSPCVPNPCINGDCIEDSLVNGGYYCSCYYPYYGPTCDQNPCEPNPCNNGDCIPDDDGGYTCDCWWPFVGPHCLGNPCEPNPCNNGDCIPDDDGGYTCDCWWPFVGPHCLGDPCDPDPCVNGVCEPTAQLGITECICDYPFIGELCDQHPCDDSDCGQGDCYPDPSNPWGYGCSCPPPWHGDFCEDGPCEPNPCQNGGNCVMALSSPPLYYTCVCPPGFTGANCETIKDPCGDLECVHGECDDSIPDVFFCTCDEGYTGPECDDPIEPCDFEPNPCQNGCLCSALPDPPGFECVNALPWFSGYFCENGPCDLEPCGNGDCTVTPYVPPYYTCECHPGWTGPDCMDPEHPCDLTPQPCLNGGVCVPNGEGYECDCPPPFYGIHCELGPCDIEDFCGVGTCIPLAVDPYYDCNCPPGWTGLHCEWSPCVDNLDCYPNGECVTELGMPPPYFMCECDPGWTGFYCNELENPCDPDPCLENEICIPLPNPPFYTCEEILNPCEPNPCLNGGTCEVGPADEIICTCPSTYYGPFCETFINCSHCVYHPDQALGFLENIYDCAGYITCKRWRGNLFIIHHGTCPAGTSWSQEHLTCVHDPNCDPTRTVPTPVDPNYDDCYLEPHDDPHKYKVGFREMECPDGLIFSLSQCTCVYDPENIVHPSTHCIITKEFVAAPFAPLYSGMPNWPLVDYNPHIPGAGHHFTGLSSIVKLYLFDNWFYSPTNTIRGISLYIKIDDISVPYQGIISNADCTSTSSVQLVIRDGELYGGLDTGSFSETPGIPLAEDVWYFVMFGYDGAQMKLHVNGVGTVTEPKTGLIENRKCPITFGRIIDDSGEHFFYGTVQNAAFYRC